MSYDRETYQRMLLADGWMRLTYRQRCDILRVIRAMKEFDRGLIHEDDYYAVLDSIEPMRVRCAVCIYRHDYKRALEHIEIMGFNMVV